MSITYNVLNDFGKFSSDELKDEPKDLTFSPYWLVAVFRQKYPTTFKREKVVQFETTTVQGSSFDQDVVKGLELEPEPLLIGNDCVVLNVSKNKSSHIGQMNCTLYPGKEYIKLIFPGDYVFVWMFNNKSKYLEVAKRVKQKQQANLFMDGLKFYGKINSVREQVQMVDDKKVGRYYVNAISFGELDATFFYEQHLSLLQEGYATVLSRLNLNLDNMWNSADPQGLIPNRTIVEFLDVFLGKGVKRNLDGGNPPELQSTFGAEGEYAHITPQTIGAILNKQIKSGRVLKTADIFETLTGLQNYSGSGIDKTTAFDFNFQPDKSLESKLIKGMNPDNTHKSDSRRSTGLDLMGRMSIAPPALTNKSFWAVANEYLNPASNEMYTCLRANADGDIVPTIVVRQLPFNTDLYSGGIKVTRFSELPRWYVPSVLIKSSDIGRSDALRFNFVHIFGNSDTKSARNITRQLAYAPPTVDFMDIARSGLRPYIHTVNCYVTDTREGGTKNEADSFSGPSKWMEVAADFLMGQHMTMTGTLQTYGIQAPICPGDNVEYDGILFHIESLTHSCSIAADGKKKFSTTLNLAHGINVNQEKPIIKPNDASDIGIYARIDGLDPAGETLPKVTTDGE